MLTSGFVQLCKHQRITGRLISTNLSSSNAWVGKSCSCLNSVHTCQKRAISMVGLGCSCLTSVHTCQKRAISIDRKNLLNHDSIVETDGSASGHLKAILDGNKRWVAAQTASDPKFFDKLAKPQRPKFLYFGCSDSRVPANEILGLG